jgi:exodeoxyribonuclease VII large subunit
VDNAAQHLILLDPKQVLARGYSMVQDVSRVIVSDARQVGVGEELRITFAKGWARTEVKERGELLLNNDAFQPDSGMSYIK